MCVCGGGSRNGFWAASGVGGPGHSVLHLTTAQTHERADSPSHTRVERKPRGMKTCVSKYISLQAWLNLLYFLHGCSKSAARVKPVMFHSSVCVCVCDRERERGRERARTFTLAGLHCPLFML